MGVNGVAESDFERLLERCCGDAKDRRPIDDLEDIRGHERLELAHGKGGISIKEGVQRQQGPEEAIWDTLDAGFGSSCFFDRSDEVDVVDAFPASDVIGSGGLSFDRRCDDFAEVAGEEGLAQIFSRTWDGKDRGPLNKAS